MKFSLVPLFAVSLVVTVTLSAQQVSYKLFGIGFSPYTDGQDPNRNLPISPTQIQQRMAVVAPYTNWIRTFGCLNGLGQAGLIAHNMGRKAAVGIWIGKDLAANDREIACGVAAAQNGQADMVIVGSEVLLRGDVSESQLLTYIQTVRQQIPSNMRVTTADVYGVLLTHPLVIQASDVVMGNFHPYWEGYPINTAVSALHLAYKRLVAAANGKTVIVSETGWPSAGNAVSGAVPSPANAAYYFLNFVSWARTNNVQYFYFEAFDEAWKALYEGPQGAAWGVWDHIGVLKPGMQAVFDGQTVPDNWSGSELPGGPGTPSIVLTFVAPYGDTLPVYGNVFHVKPSDYKVAVYILVNGGWWTKPYFNQPLSDVQADGSFFTDIYTGGVDHLATRVRAFLVPNGYNPPLLSGSGSLPAELDQHAVASADVIRGVNSICGTVRDGGSGSALPGVDVSITGAAALTAQTVATGQYCFPNLSQSATYSIGPTKTNTVFSPVSQVVPNLTGHATVNFNATGIPGPPSVPIPSNGAPAVSINVTLGWTPSGTVVSNDVHIGTSTPPPFVANVAANTFSPGALLSSTTYYWQIISKNLAGTSPSPIWSFTTQAGTGRLSKITVFRAGLWFLDDNGNFAWDGTVGGDRIFGFGSAGDLPVLGDWNGSGTAKLGVFRNGLWFLDYNGNGYWDGTAGGDRMFAFGMAGDLPVVGDWNGSGIAKIGVFRNGLWFLDYNGNGYWDGTAGGDQIFGFGTAGDLPVVGDWNGSGTAKIGVFRNGLWFLDYNGNGYWDGTGSDRISGFGTAGDIPAVGDWDGSGTAKIGVFRNGLWFLDYNGNGYWDGTAGGDRIFGFGTARDIPLSGRM